MNNKYNKAYKKNYFILTFFIILSIGAIIRLIDNAIQLDAWQYGEWLINYQHGFVRRGLIGEGIYLISLIFNNNIQITFILIISTVVLFYYYLNYQFVKNIKHNFVTYLIIFSPLFYLFFVVISKIGIKKELILYIFYILYLIQLSSINYHHKKSWKFILLFPFLLLNHEGHFFYLPYLIIPLLFLTKKNEIKILILQTMVLVIITSLTMILLYNFKGTSEHTLIICNSLGQYVPAKCDWWGPIAALNMDVSSFTTAGNNFEGTSIADGNNFFYIFNEPYTHAGFVFYILYSFIPLYFLLKFAAFKKSDFSIYRKRFFYILIAAFIFSLPLFHMAEDWSRWFSIHFHLIALLTFFLLRMKLINFENNTKITRMNNRLLNRKTKKYFFIFLFIYATSFHHPHFFWKGVKFEFTYYKIFKKISNY